MTSSRFSDAIRTRSSLLKHYCNFIWGLTGEPQEMLTEGSRVVERGSRIDAPLAERVDLSGKFLYPAFVDAHCHILPTGLDMQKLHLGQAGTKEEVLDLVRDRVRDHVRDHVRDQGEGWVHAVHYDQNRFPDGAHLTRFDLDSISADRPILLRHVNGHAGVANSAALTAAGVTVDTPNPSGGEYGRSDNGSLSGLLIENALEIVTNAAPIPSVEEMTDAILLAGHRMKELGISCASDMMTGRFDLRRELEAYRLASERGCPVATRLYVQWSQVFGRRAMPAQEFSDYQSALERASGRGSQISGIKIFADGAIGSASAAIYGHYENGVSHGLSASGQPFSGQLIYKPERLHQMILQADAAGWQVAVHSIGDYATDLVLEGFAATRDSSKHRIEHAMILSDDQIGRMADLGCYLTFQPEFLLRFGHTYHRQLGAVRASRLKRTRSVLDAGIRLSFNSDRPIVAGDPRDGIRMAVRRDGFDQGDRCTFEEAFSAYSVAGSLVNGDGDYYGTLNPGCDAEFLLMDGNLRDL